MKFFFSDRYFPGIVGALCGAALLIFSGFPAAAQTGPDSDETVITASMPASWPPHYIAEEGKKPTGFAVEILDAVAQRAGYKVNYKVAKTMREAYDLAAEGVVDLMPNVGIVPERLAEFAFTAPVETFVVSIFVRADTQDINGAPDLTGQRVGVLKRNMGLRLMEKRPDVESVVFDDLRSALFDLMAGRVDAMIYPAPVLHDLAQQVGIDHRIKTVGEPLLEVKRAIAVHPSRTEIHRRLSAAVDEFIHTPEYQKIYLRWFGPPPEYWTVARVLTFAGGAMVLNVLGFTLWHYRTIIRLNRTLEDRVEQRTQALRLAEAELLRKERLATLGELTGTVAHELRNPLGAIVTSFTIIKTRLRTGNGDITKSFERAERGIDRCTGIIDDLLKYAQIRAANRETTDFDALIRDVLNEYSRPAGISLHMDLMLVGRTIAIDSDQIRRILVNFMDNSCQAIAARVDCDVTGGHIRVRTRPCGEGIELSVSDSGVGIPSDALDRIFDPLFSTKPFGIGLGLSNAQNIVASHGGRLAMANQPDGGACVTVWLPGDKETQTEAA